MTITALLRPPGRRAGTRRPAGRLGAAGSLAPGAVATHWGRLDVGEEKTRTLALAGLPGSLRWGWLGRLVEARRERLVISAHVRPLDTAAMITEFTNKIQAQESTTQFVAGRGGKPSEGRRQSIQELKQTLDLLEGGREAVFDYALYAQVYGRDEDDLEARTRRITGAFGGYRVALRRAYGEHHKGIEATMPTGKDPLRRAQLLPGETVAACYPWGSPSLTMPRGVWYGYSTANGSRLTIDRTHKGLGNGNATVIGAGGGGKSSMLKIEQLRLAATGAQQYVIDPAESGEYNGVAAALGGQVVRMSAGSKDRINPLALPITSERIVDAEGGEYDVLREHVAGLIAFFEILIAGGNGELSTAERTVLQNAIFKTYRGARITPERATHVRTPPTLADLHRALGAEDTVYAMADRLEPYVTGAFSGMFSGQTSIALRSPYTVFDVRVGNNNDLRDAVMHLINVHVWGAVLSENRLRHLAIDESHLLLKHKKAAEFFATTWKLARKNNLLMTAATQDPHDFFKTDAGRAAVISSSLTWLFHCEGIALDAVASNLDLTAPERDYLLRANPGHGLLLAHNPQSKGERARIEVEIVVPDEFTGIVFTDADGDWRRAAPRRAPATAGATR